MHSRDKLKLPERVDQFPVWACRALLAFCCVFFLSGTLWAQTECPAAKAPTADAQPAQPGAVGEAEQASEPLASAGKATLPAGTKLYVRLETPVSTRTSHLQDEVITVVVREVQGQKGVAIPLGARVKGRLTQVLPSSTPTDRARLLINFEHLEILGHEPIPLGAKLVEVENSRETVLPDGAIQGLLASEIPLSYLEKAVGKISKSDGTSSNQVEDAQVKAFGRTDTSITYPVGTDLVLVLEQPVMVEDGLESAVGSELSPGLPETVQQLLAASPQRAAGKDGKPGDPVNLVFVGSAAQITSAFAKAGWSEAEKKSSKSIWKTVRAVAGEQGYSSAPVSQLYMFGRAEDLAFQKMLNTFAKRHHLRLWRADVKSRDGREIWLSAATHDTGMDIRPSVVSHAIDPNLDEERDKVGADLVASGLVAAIAYLTPSSPLREGMTATGGSWKTDGNILALELKSK